jgi:hypothetical protein
MRVWPLKRHAQRFTCWILMGNNLKLKGERDYTLLKNGTHIPEFNKIYKISK